MIQALERQMREAAANLEFELAAMLRDQLNELKAMAAPDVGAESVPCPGLGGHRAPPPPRVIRELTDRPNCEAEGETLGRSLPPGGS